jgi:hypothetical protein
MRFGSDATTGGQKNYTTAELCQIGRSTFAAWYGSTPFHLQLCLAITIAIGGFAPMSAIGRAYASILRKIPAAPPPVSRMSRIIET